MPGKEDREIISMPVLDVEVVLDGLKRVDLAAAKDPEHHNLDVQDEELISYGVTLVTPSF